MSQRSTRTFLNKYSLLIDALILLSGLFAVFLAWYLAGNWIDTNVKAGAVNETDAQARGLFGDKFGALNALFSGFAFVAVSFTIYLQRRDMTHTVRAFEEQTRSDQKQRFDSTFFQLIALHNDITNRLRTPTAEGRLTFDEFNKKLELIDPDFTPFRALMKLDTEVILSIRDTKKIDQIICPDLNESESNNLTTTLKSGVKTFETYLSNDVVMHEKKIRQAYTKVATTEIDFFSHYFRNLYHILVYIHDSKLIDDDERIRYAKIVRSQLSEHELVALFYNSITKIELPGRTDMELGFPKMGKLLADFDILQNMSPRSLFHGIHDEIFKKNNQREQRK